VSAPDLRRPTRLRVEHLDEPLGMTERAPRLSWTLPHGSTVQQAYRIRAGDWDSGRIDSGESVLVPYGGPPLHARERVSWQVMAWAGGVASEWSAPSAWEMGLLAPGDWSAQWIEPPEEPGAPGERPAHLLRHAFTLRSRPAQARVYATAHGIYELFLNGVRVGDHELAPGFTAYRSILHVQAHDVTDLLVAGRNVIGAVLSDGWYRGRFGFTRQPDCYGDRVALLAQLHADDVVVGTGPDWSAATAEIVAADLMDGQVVDLARVRPGWSDADGAPDGWRPVVPVVHDFARLRASPQPPVRRVATLRAVAVGSPAPGRQVFDLGQNISGWVRLTDLGPDGAALTLTHGEALDEHGDVTTDHLRAWDFATGAPLPAGQVDRVTSAGRAGDVFEPRHTTHGFRYVRVEGHPGALSADAVQGVAVHTDLRRTGWFRCDDERLNRLHEAAVWSFRDNACDLPTDCPQRERAGWTGDWQLFAATAAFVYDVAGFSTKWLRDLAAEQLEDGRVTNMAPEPLLPGDPMIDHITGSAGWGDAAVIVPWEIWRAYGDRRLLEEQWDSMVAWVDWAAMCARERRHPDRAASRPDPAPHESHLWDTGFHWGEWLEPGETVTDLQAFGQLDKGDVATAYLSHSAKLLAAIATVLGRTEAAERYTGLAAGARDAWRAEYVAADGALRPDTQANHVRALAFGLVPEALRAQTTDRLVALIRERDTHLATGFLATPDLLGVLVDAGRADVAFELLLQDTPPSWLAMIERGATTIWEDWDGIDADGVPHASLNHYSKGAVVSFLHRRVAGIRLLDDGPAYRHFRIEPTLGGGLRAASAEHDAPYGRIASSWRLDGVGFRLEVEVPAGTTAEIVMPDGTRTEICSGTATFTCEVPR
jgi:alpha-L-rhamnosidase